MNILIGNTQEFNPQIGGVEKVSTTLALKFSEIGHSVYFAACLKSKFSKEYTPAVEQLLLPNERYYTSENVASLLMFCERKKIDIILNQAGNILDFTRLCEQVSKQLDIPLISAVHINPMNRISILKDYKCSKIYKYSFVKTVRKICLMPFRYKRVLGAEKRLYKEICAMSDKIVLLSQRYKKELLDLAGDVFSNKVLAIANPGTSVLQANLMEKEKTILFVGRLDFGQKRPDRLIQVWEKLYKDYPEWKLKIAGDGPCKQDLIAYVKKKKICNIEFLGFCNLDEQYRAASLLCMTSTIEGFGMVLLEGFSYGCIPIAFDSFKAVFDIIEDSKNGFIIKAYRLKNYEKKLRLLMNDTDLRKRMSNEARKGIHKFELDNIADNWIYLFKELVGEK